MLKKLKEYKEFIAIIVFFLGGYIWLQNEFPNKDDLKKETNTLNCLLEKYMILTQLQIRGQELEKQIRELANRTIKASASNNADELSLALRFELDKLKEDLSDKKNDLKKNKDKMEEINSELARNICGKEKP